MKAYSAADLKAYLRDDVILQQLANYQDDAAFPSHRWLLEMAAKRMIYHDIYGALFGSNGLRILDVGGGFCGLTREIAKRHAYTLVEIPDAGLSKVANEAGFTLFEGDWRDFAPDGTYDLVIANDLFPNVDQRLEWFIKKFRAHSKRMILTLTAYDTERFYKTKRVDAEEILIVRPYDSALISYTLQRAGIHEMLPTLTGTEQSLFPNKRVIYRLDLS